MQITLPDRSLEREMIIDALKTTGGNRTRAAACSRPPCASSTTRLTARRRLSSVPVGQSWCPGRSGVPLPASRRGILPKSELPIMPYGTQVSS